MPSRTSPLTCVIVGAGHRSVCYADYAIAHPERMRIVGVADPNSLRREKMAERYGFPKENCFESADALALVPRFADAVINGTMDHQHVPTALPLLRAGYDMLLEKPFAISEEEMWLLADAAREHGRKVMVCHVLRYSPFYSSIRRRILDGEIGDIIALETSEHVSYHHMSVGYVRGKWNNREKCRAGILLAKCCHDMDMTMWMMSPAKPLSVASFGGNFQFVPEKAPKNAGTRCLVDCSVEPDCPYSAKKLHIDHPQRWSFYVWSGLEHHNSPTLEEKIHSLKTDNPHGRCAWRCDNDAADHQTVIVRYDNGSTSTHSLIGGSARGCRSIHVVGTRGEILGIAEDNRYTVRTIDASPGCEYSDTVIDLNADGPLDGHGGGDIRLVADFVNILRGGQPSISCTALEDSIAGHLSVFRADLAMETGQTQDMRRR